MFTAALSKLAPKLCRAGRSKEEPHKNTHPICWSAFSLRAGSDRKLVRDPHQLDSDQGCSDTLVGPLTNCSRPHQEKPESEICTNWRKNQRNFWNLLKSAEVSRFWQIWQIKTSPLVISQNFGIFEPISWDFEGSFARINGPFWFLSSSSFISELMETIVNLLEG